jgi:hypothetical protein
MLGACIWHGHVPCTCHAPGRPCAGHVRANDARVLYKYLNARATYMQLLYVPCTCSFMHRTRTLGFFACHVHVPLCTRSLRTCPVHLFKCTCHLRGGAVHAMYMRLYAHAMYHQFTHMPHTSIRMHVPRAWICCTCTCQIFKHSAN